MDSSSVLPSPTLLLPSLLQHTLHDVHELQHLVQHDALQFAHFEREKLSILQQCSSAGYDKHNGRLAKMAWQQWTAVLRMRVLRKQTLLKLVQRDRARQLAWALSRLSTRTTIQHAQDLMLQQLNRSKTAQVAVLLRSNRAAGLAAQTHTFRLWVLHARARRKAKRLLCAALDRSGENRIGRLWDTWKMYTLRERALAAVEQGQEDAAAQAQAHRAAQLYKLHKLLALSLIHI